MQQDEKLIDESIYRLLFENCLEGILLTLPSGEVLDANPACCELLGYTRDELVAGGRKLFVSDPTLQAALDERNGQGFFKGVLTYVCKNGKRIPCEVFSKLFMDQQNHTYTSILFRDISEKKQFESEMARLDRLNLIGEMAAGIGHEIRNPLTTVRGFLQLFKSKKDFDHYGEYFVTMIDELDRANLIITEFLSLAKNKRIDLELDSLNIIVSKIYPLIQADALRTGKNVMLQLGEIPNILLDENEIRQCILNLVRNGLEAISGKGVVTIKTYQEDEQVVLEIQDTGRGISPDILEKLGNPFITTKETGTGLGIPIIYKIVERHKANMKIETSSAGTTFFIRFRQPETISRCP